MQITTASNTGLPGDTNTISLDVYRASYNASALAGKSKPQPEPKPEGAHVGTTTDQEPFATWDSMMSAIAQRPGGEAVVFRHRGCPPGRARRDGQFGGVSLLAGGKRHAGVPV